MFETILDEEERGQVGIGTLLVIIAMVLVAAIAAGVLINTAGFLQTKSSETGEKSSQQVTNRIQILSATGQITNDNNYVDVVDLTVARNAGSDNINVWNTSIEYVGPDNAVTLVANTSVNSSDNSAKSTATATEFNVSTIRDVDNSHPVINDGDDRFKITIDIGDIRTDSGLPEGESAQLKFVTRSGAITVYDVRTPISLSGKSVAKL